MADLRHVRQVCAEQHLNRHEHTNKLPPPPPPLLLSSSQILLNSDSPISESISLPPLVSIPNGSHRSSLARTVTQHLNITNGISFGRNSLFMEDENMKTIMARASLSSSSGANTPASSLHGGASSPTLPTSPSVSFVNRFVSGNWDSFKKHLHQFQYHLIIFAFALLLAHFIAILHSPNPQAMYINITQNRWVKFRISTSQKCKIIFTSCIGALICICSQSYNIFRY